MVFKRSRGTLPTIENRCLQDVDVTNLPAASETAFALLDGHRIEYSRFKARDKKLAPVIFLHEGLGSVTMWHDFPAMTAATTGAEVIVFSRRGYGKSSRLADPHDISYMHHEAEFVLPRLLNFWQVSAPILIGHSDGASIALIYAADPGSNVTGIFLMAPHYFVEEKCIISIARVRERFLSSDLKLRLGEYHNDPEHTFWGWNDIWLHPNFPNWNIEALLSHITCPIFAVQGENEEYSSMQQIDGIAALSAGPVDLLKLTNCGHAPHRDKQTQTLRAIADFVTQCNNSQYHTPR